MTQQRFGHVVGSVVMQCIDEVREHLCSDAPKSILQGGSVIPEGWGNRSAEIKTCHVNIVRIQAPGEVRN